MSSFNTNHPVGSYPHPNEVLPYLLPFHSVFQHLKKKNSYITMHFVNFSSAFNTISPDWKTKNFGLEFNALQLDTRLPHSAHPPWVHTNHPWLHSQTPRDLYCKVTGGHHRHLSRSAIVQSDAQRIIYCSMSAKPRSWLLIYKEGGKDPHLCLH